MSRSALGWTYYYTGDYQRARPIFLELTRLESTWADPWAGLGWTAARQGQTAEAQQSFRTAMGKSAGYVATPELRKLVAERPGWVDLWRDLGWALYQQRAFAAAEGEFRSLVVVHPNDADGLRGLGYSLYMLRRHREAIPVLRRSLELGPTLAPVREQVEIPGSARLHPILSDAGSTLAWSHFHAGDFAVALQHFRVVTERHPDWADPWSGLGWTLLKLGNRVEAEGAFGRSLQAEPSYPDALQGLQALRKAAQ